LRKEIFYQEGNIQKETRIYGILCKVWGPTQCGFGILRGLWRGGIGAKRNNNFGGRGCPGFFAGGLCEYWYDK